MVFMGIVKLLCLLNKQVLLTACTSYGRVDNLSIYLLVTSYQIIMQGQLEDNETYDNSSREIDRVTCQYKYMMRVSQPDVPCPDDNTLKTLLESHNHLMSVSSQNDGMCNGMPYPPSIMVCMYVCILYVKYHYRDVFGFM